MACSCEKGIAICPEGERLWRAYLAAADIEATLLDASSGAQKDDPIVYDRWRLAHDQRRAAMRVYNRHVDGEGESAPEVPERLLFTVYEGENVP